MDIQHTSSFHHNEKHGDFKTQLLWNSTNVCTPCLENNFITVNFWPITRICRWPKYALQMPDDEQRLSFRLHLYFNSLSEILINMPAKSTFYMHTNILVKMMQGTRYWTLFLLPFHPSEHLKKFLLLSSFFRYPCLRGTRQFSRSPHSIYTVGLLFPWLFYQYTPCFTPALPYPI